MDDIREINELENRSRREFISIGAKYGATAAFLAAATTTTGVSIAEAAEAIADIEKAKKSAADHSLLFGCGGTPNRWPDGQIFKQNFDLTGLLQLKEAIERNSSGKVHVDIKFGGALGGQGAVGRKVQQGIVAGSQSSTQNMAAHAPVWNATDFPYVIGSVENYWRMLFSKEVNDTLRKSSMEQGVIPLCVFPQTRWLELKMGLPAEVRDPKQLDGLKIRVTGSKLEQTAFNILPSNPTPVAWGEVYSAVKEGAVDGIHVGTGSVADAGIYEVIGQLVNTEWMYNADTLFISTKWFNGLPPAVQGAVMEGAYEAQVYNYAIYEPAFKFQAGIRPDSPADAAWNTVKAKRVYLTDSELDNWKDALSYERNKEIFDPLIERFGKTEYETVKRVANSGDSVVPRRWWL
ncbi:TRAP transporter substrate-binding protein [Sneathiella litorea]|uniref:Uncharacterized protein n=1 Tax=Sneathiella litorea TaxID=2606216 RepID=A0A6L8W800_9PROT|nr:TRAP transporter substrate-binding protein [Sneathiella litorea]MZR30644.1 hypothetical protein [Sneathiella litorea]